MDKYTLYWADGTKEEVEGSSIAQAFSNAGYSAGAMSALDFFTCDRDEGDYEYDKKSRTWKNVRLVTALILDKLENRSTGLHLTGGRAFV